MSQTLWYRGLSYPVILREAHTLWARDARGDGIHPVETGRDSADEWLRRAGYTCTGRFLTDEEQQVARDTVALLHGALVPLGRPLDRGAHDADQDGSCIFCAAIARTYDAILALEHALACQGDGRHILEALEARTVVA